MACGIKFNGSGFLNTKTSLLKNHGPEKVERILSTMSTEAQRSARFALASTQYPVEHISEFLAAIKQVLGPDDPELNFKISKQAAKDTFSMLYKLYFKLGKPQAIINKAASIWTNLCNSGRLLVDTPRPRQVVLTLMDFDYIDPEFCGQRLRGWYQAPLELSGCTVTESLHCHCRAFGDSVCRWRFSWR